MISNGVQFLAWGTKNGHQVFFNTSGIDAESKSVYDTLEDVRGLVRMTQPEQVFYSVDSTVSYRIFTLYRTVIDWGNRPNAYLALSLFVPVTSMVERNETFKMGEISVLRKLLDIYETKYIDENYRIAKVLEDKDLFFRVVESCKTRPYEGPHKPLAGHDKKQYAGVLYSDEEELHKFFHNPYLPEFKPYKEIFFLPKGNDKLRLESEITTLQVIPAPLGIFLDIRIIDKYSKAEVTDCEVFLGGERIPYTEQPIRKTLSYKSGQTNLRISKLGYNDWSGFISNESKEITAEMVKKADFYITVTNNQGPVYDALVKVGGIEYRSDTQGKVFFRDTYEGETLTAELISLQGYTSLNNYQLKHAKECLLTREKPAPEINQQQLLASISSPSGTPSDSVHNSNRTTQKSNTINQPTPQRNLADNQPNRQETKTKWYKQHRNSIIIFVIVLIITPLLLWAVQQYRERTEAKALNTEWKASQSKMNQSFGNLKSTLNVSIDSLGKAAGDTSVVLKNFKGQFDSIVSRMGGILKDSVGTNSEFEENKRNFTKDSTALVTLIAKVDEAINERKKVAPAESKPIVSTEVTKPNEQSVSKTCDCDGIKKRYHGTYEGLNEGRTPKIEADLSLLEKSGCCRGDNAKTFMKKRLSLYKEVSRKLNNFQTNGPTKVGDEEWLRDLVYDSSRFNILSGEQQSFLKSQLGL